MTENKKQKKDSKIENAFVIAQYFGFHGLDIPEVNKDQKKKGEVIRKGNTFKHPLLPSVEEVVGVLENVSEQAQKRSTGDPLMVYHEGGKKEKLMHLHIIGTPKTIAEAILIKTAMSILEEYGYKDISVEINHIGGKDSMGKFLKEINNYYRKNLGQMSSKCRQLFKDSAHSLLLCSGELDSELLENSPSSVSFLSDLNRDSFKEIIEYLENQNISYQINKNLIGDPNYSSHTVFSLIDTKTGNVLATGTRYNQLAKKIGFKKETPSVKVTIKIKDSKKVPLTKAPKKEKMKVFFLQIGPRAKKKSLEVIDCLRKAGIAVHHSLSRDRLTTQLQWSQKLKTQFLIIMGQKEALDNSVVVRDTATHKQVSVPIKELADYLKNNKIM